LVVVCWAAGWAEAAAAVAAIMVAVLVVVTRAAGLVVAGRVAVMEGAV